MCVCVCWSCFAITAYVCDLLLSVYIISQPCVEYVMHVVTKYSTDFSPIVVYFENVYQLRLFIAVKVKGTIPLFKAWPNISFPSSYL